MEKYDQDIKVETRESVDPTLIRVQELQEELKGLEEYQYMTDKDVAQSIQLIGDSVISEESIHKIKDQAYKDIDYVEYIEEISSFLDRQNKLHESGKPSLEVEESLLAPGEEEEFEIGDGYYALMPPAGNYHKNKITVSTSNNLNDRNTSPRGVLYNLAVKGFDPNTLVVQHEVIHHYQRNKESSPLLKLLHSLSVDKNSKKLLEEIHARLHHSMVGAPWAFDDDKNIKALSTKNYGLSKKEQDELIRASDCIKKLYALDVSNRRIAHLVSGAKDLADISLFEQEVRENMSEKNINKKELTALVSIDELQRRVVHLRSRKIAQEMIKELMFSAK